MLVERKHRRIAWNRCKFSGQVWKYVHDENWVWQPWKTYVQLGVGVPRVSIETGGGVRERIALLQFSVLRIVG